jgi:hypothetical protein
LCGLDRRGDPADHFKVLLYVAIGLAVGAVALVVRWYPRRVDGLGRVHPFPFLSVSVLLALSAGALVPVVEQAREEHRLAAVASKLVGSHVTVHCQTFGQTFTDSNGDLGYVEFGANGVPEHATTLNYDTCKHLAAYLASDKAHPSQDEVVAVHTLTHESMHMAGMPTESIAECRAVQRDETTARLLGASAAEARALAERYWRTVYRLMPTDYRSADCGPGLPLDEHLATAPW